MAVKYLSQEWYEQMKAGLEKAFDKPGKVTTSFAHHILGCPDGKDRWARADFENSILKDYTMGEGTPPADTAFIGYSSYENFRKVITGELGGQAALASGEFKLKGNIMKAMKMIGVYNSLEAVMRSIDTEF